MTERDIKQIILDGYHVGIVGLEEAIKDVSVRLKDASDEEIEKELIKILGKKNYIPKSARRKYGEAFLREYKKSIGISVEEDHVKLINIKVLGPGCYQCDRLEQELMKIIEELGITASIQHVRDIKEIGKYGVMGTPALVINGEVKCVGRVPPSSQLIKWLKEENKR